MPDFDKDLNPSTVTESSPDLSPSTNVRAVSDFINPRTATPDLSHSTSVFDLISEYSSKSDPNLAGTFVTSNELEANKRYETYNPTLPSQEDFAAYGQSGFDQLKNGVLKGVNLAATTVVGTFGTLGGAVAALGTGKLSTIWDNPVMQGLDKWNNYVDQELLPNYYTDIEKNAKWYSTDNWLTTNFLADKFIKNAGFAVGAMYSGNIANAAILGAFGKLGSAAARGAATLAESNSAFSKVFTPLLKASARAMSVSENAKAYEILAKGVSNLAEVEEATAGLAKSALTFNKVNDFARRTAIATLSTQGEAAFEALQTGNKIRETLINEYKAANDGMEPTGDDLAKIEDTVASAGNTAFLANLAVLAFTENLQLPYQLGSSYKNSRNTALAMFGEANDVVKDAAGKWIAKGAPTSKLGRYASNIYRGAGYVFDPKEMAQEGLQYVTGEGVTNYFNKAYHTKDADAWVDGVVSGFGQLGSKEGMESMILGGLSGGLMQARGKYVETSEKAKNTTSLLEKLNSAPEFKNALKDRINSTNRAIVLNQLHQKHILSGNELEARDTEADQMHNYLMPRIKYGRFDLLMDDIADLKKMSSTSEGLASLKEQGIGNINDDIESFGRRLDNFEKVAKNTETIYNASYMALSGITQTDKDGNPVLNEEGKPIKKYGQGAIEAIAYAQSKIADYDGRINKVSAELLGEGVLIGEALDTVVNTTKARKTATKESLEIINSIDEMIDNMDTTQLVKDDLKTKLSDSIEMTVRRKNYIDDVKGIMDSPEGYEIPEEIEDSKVVKIKQLSPELTKAGKPRTISAELEIGKDYYLAEPLSREGNTLTPSPKITVLSKTLGGEYEVKLPNGTITFLKPEEFKDYKITDQEVIDDDVNEVVDKVVKKYLKKAKISIPEGTSAIDHLNSLDNQKLVDDIEAELSGELEEYRKEVEESVRKRALLESKKGELEKIQNEATIDTEDAPTEDSTVDSVVKFSSSEPNLKDADKAFISTSTKTVENNPNPPAYVVRYNAFMNRARNFKNRAKLQAVMFTYNQQKALGLDGAVEMAWNKKAGEFKGEALNKVTNPKDGNVMIVFVQVDKNGKQSFIDENGNVIGKVGEQVDLNKIVMADMPTTELTVGGFPRTRESQKDEAVAYSKAWEKYRTTLFANADKVLKFNFVISKGKPIINEKSPEVNTVGGTLLSDNVVSKEQVLLVNTKDSVTHTDGVNYQVPKGRPYIQHEDLLQIVNNNLLNDDQAKTVLGLFKELVDVVIAQAEGKSVTFDANKRIFLNNILLFSNKESVTSANKIYLSGTNLHIGEKVYDLTKLDKFEKEIVDQLKTTYHTVNNKTLKAGLSKSFKEFYTENGEIKSRDWKNYQSYLLSSTNPDGTARPIASVPVTTSVSKMTDAVPYNYTRKYVTLQELELPVEEIKKTEPVKQPVPTEGSNTSEEVKEFTSSLGDIKYTVSKGKDGLPIVSIPENDPIIAQYAKDTTKFAAIKDTLLKLNSYDGALSNEELANLYFTLLIRNQLGAAEKQTETTEETVVEETKTDASPTENVEIDHSADDPDLGLFSVASGTEDMEKMTQYDMDEFKNWAEKNLPTMPYRFLDNMLKTKDGRGAWGKVAKGVAYIVKNSPKGTGYHEAFHYVFDGFLSDAEKQEIYNEVRERAGSFVDRQSGLTVDYDNATDLQIEEKIADEFADFRLGKISAKSLSQTILDFFRGILDFFKSFVNKGSKVEDLFKAIETGEFAYKSYPDLRNRLSEKYSAIPGLSQQQINDIVQDVSARIFLRIFRDNKSLFNFEKINIAEYLQEVKTNPLYQGLPNSTWTALVSKTKDFIRSYKIEFDNDSFVNINDENSNKNDYAAEAFTVDYKKSSPFAVKLLVSTLVRTSRNADGQIMPFTKAGSKFYELIPFNQAFGTLLRHFENVRDQDTFVQKLVELAKDKSEYVALLKRLKGSVETGGINFASYDAYDWRLFINTFLVFTKQKPDAIKQFTKGNEVHIGSAVQVGSIKDIKDDWYNNVILMSSLPNALIRKEQGGYVVNKEKIKEVSDKNFNDQLNFLNQVLNISFGLANYNRLNQKQKKDFATAVGNIKLGLTSAKTNKVRSIRSKQLDIDTGVKELARLFALSTSRLNSTSLVNVNGDQRQEFSEANAPSYFESVFNSVNNLDELLQEMPQLNDTFSAHSDILKKGGVFFDEDGDRTGELLRVQYIDGIEDELNKKGTTTASLKEGQRLTVEINQNIAGSYYILIPADSSTEWMMNVGNRIDYEKFKDGRTGVEESLPIFHGYLIDEINLARDWKNRSKLRNVGDKAKELRWFKGILPESILEDINEMIAADSITDDEIQSYIDTNAEAINKSIVDYLNDTKKEVKQLLMDNNEVTYLEKQGKYSYPGLVDNFFKNKLRITEADLDNLLTFVNTNYVLNNIEYHKILFGDPAQFAVKDGILDETKRIKSFLSQRRKTYNSVEYNNFLNNRSDFNTADGIALTDKDYGYHEAKDFLRTITANDVNLVSPFANVDPAYAKVNETDASSWIAPTAWREIKMKNGQWSDEAEAFHQWEMAFTRQNFPGYKYSNTELQAHDIELMTKPRPHYIIDILKPIVSGNKYGKNNIDLVLDKFSQVPIYYSAVKGTNLASLYKQMFDNKVDYVVVISGRKVGAESLHELYNKDGSFNDAAMTDFIDVPWSAYGIQVENSYEKAKLQTRGSQLNKLATVDLYSEGTPIGDTPERQEEIKNLVEKNTKDLANLVNQGYVNLLNKLGIEDIGGSYAIVDNSNVAKILRETMLSQQMSMNALDSIALDENGRFVIPFEASTNYTEIKNILYSLVNKSIVSPKMNGFSGVQVSAAMWENALEGRVLLEKYKTVENGKQVTRYREISREAYEALSDKDKGNVSFGSKTLKFYEDEDGKRHCEILLPNWIKSKFDRNKFKTDEEILAYLKTADGGKMLRGIGFRIPTQALSSVEVFEIKGFLPDYMGRSVVVPSEITTKAGSDFDIDKLNMYLRSIYKDVDGDVRLVKLRGTEDQTVEEREEQTKNYFRKVFDDTIKGEIERLSKYDNFRNELVSIFSKLEGLQQLYGAADVTNLNEDDQQFYAIHENLLTQIIDQATEAELMPSQYILAQIETIGDVKDSLFADILASKTRGEYVDRMYAAALENEYYDSLEALLTLPENFKRLTSPNTDSTLKGLAKEIDQLEGVDESAIVNPLTRRSFMSFTRHAFTLAKKWVGIAAVNITGNSLYQKTKVYVKDSSTTLFLPHNTVEINGQKHISLSNLFKVGEDAEGAKQYVSDKLSEYANAFVDVSKDPYILKLIYSDRIVGSFMFLERAGVPTDTITYFMNQPIIKDYIKYLDTTKKSLSAISLKENTDYIKKNFGTNNINLTKANTLLTGLSGVDNVNDLNELLKNAIKNKKSLSTLDNAVQHAVLDQFVKIVDLANANFKISQAVNYDTTNFKNANEFDRKNALRDVAKEENLIDGIDGILESSFISPMISALDKATKALGEYLVFNKDEFRSMLKDLLKYYATNQYIGADRFVKIAEKATASLLDYVIYTKGEELNLKDLLVDEDSVFDRVVKFKEIHPDVKMLDKLSYAFNENEKNPTKTIKLTSKIDNAFDENMLTGYMREMRNHPDAEVVKLYNDIVKVAITQGSVTTPSSLKKIIPVEDYSRMIAPVINNLVYDEDIKNFAKANWFQKNNFNDTDIVPAYSPTLFGAMPLQDGTTAYVGPREEPFSFTSPQDEDISVYRSPSVLINEKLGATYENKKLIKVRVSANIKGSGAAVIVIPRIFSKMLGEGKNKRLTDIDFITGQTVPVLRRAALEATEGKAINIKYGYELVMNGEKPVYDYDDNGNPYYIYKAINLYGDPGLAVEYGLFEGKSVLDNNTRKLEIDEIIPTKDIINEYRNDNFDFGIADDRDYETGSLETDNLKCE